MNSGQESISTIRDSINDIITTENPKIDASDISSSNTVDYIMNKKINNLEEYLDSKVINIYQRPWKKLELKLKLRKIDEYYCDGPLEEKPTSPTSGKRSAKKGVEAFSNFKIDEIKSLCSKNEKKRLRIDYDVDSCRICNIIVI
jgi:hypothetical protein